MDMSVEEAQNQNFRTVSTPAGDRLAMWKQQGSHTEVEKGQCILNFERGAKLVDQVIR